MGKQVRPMRRLYFVSFEPVDGKFLARMPVESLLAKETDAERLAQDIALVYSQSISTMRSVVKEICALRAVRLPVPAQSAWVLGDAIFALRRQLMDHSFEIDGIYAHLVRDLGMKRKWLEKVVILRRYVPRVDHIPEGLTWGKFEHGTKKLALSLARQAESMEQDRRLA